MTPTEAIKMSRKRYTEEQIVTILRESAAGAKTDELCELRGLPAVITSDNGSEFTCRAMDEWAHRNKVKLDFIRPGKPVENGYGSRTTTRSRRTAR